MLKRDGGLGECCSLSNRYYDAGGASSASGTRHKAQAQAQAWELRLAGSARARLLSFAGWIKKVVAEESDLTKRKTKRCGLFVGSCSDRLTSKEMSKKRSEVESRGDRARFGGLRRAGNGK